MQITVKDASIHHSLRTRERWQVVEILPMRGGQLDFLLERIPTGKRIMVSRSVAERAFHCKRLLNWLTVSEIRTVERIGE